MKWEEGTELLVNGWTISAGSPAQFVHRARIEGGSSDNRDGDITVRYRVTPLDEDGEVVDVLNLGFDQEYPMQCREENIEDFEPVSEVGDEVDKERFSFHGECQRCGEEADMSFIYGRSLRHAIDHFSALGEFQCMECCFTFHERDWDRRPDWLEDMIRSSFEELPHEIKMWATDRLDNL